MVTVHCKFDLRSTMSNQSYCCEVKNQAIIISTTFNNTSNKHSPGKTNRDVRSVFINVCRMTLIPESLGQTFSNLMNLYINNSYLRSITKFDLVHFEQLERIHIIGNDIEFLPGDLFEFTRNVKYIQFGQNKIKYIGPKILEGLDVRSVSFSGNVNINCWYYEGKLPNNAITLEQLKWKIRNDCEPPMDEREMLKTYGRDPDDGNSIPKKKKPKFNFLDDLKELSKLDDYKDFTIKVEDREFRVHKFVFAARSLTFAEVIKENLNADFLELHDIPIELFKCILSYVYTDKITDNVNVHEIFEAAGNLKIRGLMDLTEELLMSSIENEENLDLLHNILDLAGRFERDNLKLKASEVIKKHFEMKMLKEEKDDSSIVVKIEKC